MNTWRINPMLAFKGRVLLPALGSDSKGPGVAPQPAFENIHDAALYGAAVTFLCVKLGISLNAVGVDCHGCDRYVVSFDIRLDHEGCHLLSCFTPSIIFEGCAGECDDMLSQMVDQLGASFDICSTPRRLLRRWFYEVGGVEALTACAGRLRHLAGERWVTSRWNVTSPEYIRFFPRVTPLTIEELGRALAEADHDR